MPTRKFRPTTPSRRHMELPDFSELTTDRPEKSLLEPLKKTGGRNNTGRVTVRHRGGGHKRRYRIIDFYRDKMGIPAKVVSREYDPNRSAWISLLQYADGEKRYIISPLQLEVGTVIEAGKDVEARVGNALPLKKIPVGTLVHGVELAPGGRAKVARAAGTSCQLMAVEGGYARLRLPSGEIRLFKEDCMATVGQVGNIDHKNIVHGKAGRVRHLGIRPTVRGTAMNPVDHPHGGGEGRHYVGGPPRTFSGKPAKGVPTRKPGKPSSRLIVTRRNGRPVS
ncbi:MAG: 50S ribosomal protein L2 [Candidatus Bipolaricaulota bacterium]|nr:50S ribosomal protein L2 [Candidatus Bipolaricaulota bacterium]MDW8140715.1 50S ribosomal protein L2 [Candidatus Bipolaricaulota bacterium]